MRLQTPWGLRGKSVSSRKTRKRPTAIYHHVESNKSTHVEWSKTWRVEALLWKLWSFNSSWLCCAPLQSEKTLLSLRECYMVAVILLLLPSCHAIPFCCWPLQHCQTLRLTPNQAEVARDSSGFWKQTVGASIAVKSLRIFSVSPPRCTPNN